MRIASSSLREDELVGLGSVDEDAVDARRTEVARRVVLATQARGVDGVHEHVRHGVYLRLLTVAELRVDGPHLYAARHFLVGTERVGHVAVARVHRSVGIHLVEASVVVRVYLRRSTHRNGKQKRNKPQYVSY